MTGLHSWGLLRETLTPPCVSSGNVHCQGNPSLEEDFPQGKTLVCGGPGAG